MKAVKVSSQDQIFAFLEQESASESLAEEDEFAEKQEEIKIPNQSAQKASNGTARIQVEMFTSNTFC